MCLSCNRLSLSRFSRLAKGAIAAASKPLFILRIKLVVFLKLYHSFPLLKHITSYDITEASRKPQKLEIILFLKTAAKNKIRAVINDLKKLVVGVLTVTLPTIPYTAVFVFSFNHGLSLLAMGAIAFSELAMAAYLLNHT